jgi:hypothetical protein
MQRHKKLKEGEKINLIIKELEEVIAMDRRTIEGLVMRPYDVKDGVYANIPWQGGNCHGLETALHIVQKINSPEPS